MALHFLLCIISEFLFFNINILHASNKSNPTSIS